VTATGVFDLETDAALRAWQEEIGLPVTGVVAPNSWRKLWAGTR
jgi:peptidoglycan hydrolase-like protein with peptidoglycan-binding domain